MKKTGVCVGEFKHVRDFPLQSKIEFMLLCFLSFIGSHYLLQVLVKKSPSRAGTFSKIEGCLKHHRIFRLIYEISYKFFN